MSIITDLLKKKKILKAIQEYEKESPEAGKQLEEEYKNTQQRFFDGEVDIDGWDRFKKYIIGKLMR